MKQAMLAATILFLPALSHADVTQFVFTTTPQSVAPNVATEQITLEAQDASGQSVSGRTVCIRLVSSSASGQFSTNTAWSDPFSSLTLTLSSNQSRRNFYYRDSGSGAHTLTAQAAPRPDGGTCTQWSPESGVSWSANHVVIVSGASSSTSGQQDNSATTTTSQSQPVNTAPAQSTPVSSYVAPPEPTLFADAGGDRTVIVGAHTEYRARAYNRKKELVENASFRWNFGDATTAVGKSVMHHFEYPGRYVIVLSIAQNFESVSDRIVVNAEPARLGFFIESDGSVRIENNSGRDIDLSKWVVRAFFREFVLPEESIILTGASMRISSKTTGFFAGPETELAYPNGVTAFRANTAASTPAVQETPVVTVVAVGPSAPASIKRPMTVTADIEEDVHIEPVSATATPHTAAAAAAVAGGYWWLGALAIAGISGAGIIAVRRMREKEWDVIEDSE